MVRALASHARGRRFESYCLYQSGSHCGRKRKGTDFAVPFSFASFGFAALCHQQCGSRNNVALRVVPNVASRGVVAWWCVASKWRPTQINRFAYPALRFGTSPTVSTI